MGNDIIGEKERVMITYDIVKCGWGNNIAIKLITLCTYRPYKRLRNGIVSHNPVILML